MSPRSKTCGLCATKGGKSVSANIVIKECQYCKEQFPLPRWRVNQGRGKFCSRECKDLFLTTIKGPDHHKYKGRYAPIRYTGTNWQQARQAVLERANGHCEWCNRDLSTVKRFAVHHNIGIHKFDNPEDGHTPDNLSAICQSCHAKYHGLGKIPDKGGDANECENVE